MKVIVRFIIFIGLNYSFGSDVEKSIENDPVDKLHVNHYDKRKIQNLREALLAFDGDSLQKLLSNANLTKSELTPTTPAPDINNELIDIVKDDTIGNFDQITIERDDEGAIVVTKTKRVFADGRKHQHKSHQSTVRTETPTKSDRVQLKSVPITNLNQTSTDLEGAAPESETDENAFIQNEQLITICLAALGVTSTGLLMWIAIQHLYGIYTDFKKTINPMSYHDSNYSEEYECTSVVSARMADRPPTYDHSQESHCRDPYTQRLPNNSNMPAPPYVPPSDDHRFETGSLDLNTQQQMSYNSHHRAPSGPHQDPDSDTSSWESDDEEEYNPPVTINPVASYNPPQQRGARTVSLGNPAFDDENAQLQRRFALRRRMERFRRYRRQSVNAIQCSTAEPSVEDVPNDPSNQVIHPPNFRSLSQPVPKPPLTEPEPPDEIDRLSTNSAPPVEHDFESAPELAELDILHHILSQSNSRTQPRRTTSFASYVDRKVDQNGSIVSVMNVQIEIEVPTSSTCRVEEIAEEFI